MGGSSFAIKTADLSSRVLTLTHLYFTDSHLKAMSRKMKLMPITNSRQLRKEETEGEQAACEKKRANAS